MIPKDFFAEIENQFEPRMSRGQAKMKPFTEVLICQPGPDSLQMVRASYQGTDIDMDHFTLSLPEAANLFKKRIQKGPVIILLDKAKYLVKVLEFPHVRPEEVDNLLRLEVETLLPPDYGPVKISYLPLPLEKEGYQKYQVFICRQSILNHCITQLHQIHLEADYFLPSIIAWYSIFDILDEKVNLCAAMTDTQQYEVANYQANQDLTVRTIRTTDEHNTGQLDHGLIDCVRPLLTDTPPERLPLPIGWIGPGCPHHLANGRLTFKEITVPGSTKITPSESAGPRYPFLALTAAAMLALRHPILLQTSNMLPDAVHVRREKKIIYRWLLAGCLTFLLALVLIVAALKIAIFRYERANMELTQKISQIKTEGEAVGRQIQQLKAIADAHATSNDFYSILNGLHDATPPDMTYSHVELKETGAILLRGQAQSLSLPFLAPEKLEQQTMFEQVLLKDAGQSKREAGTITEFRIDCVLQRGEKP